MADAYVSLDPVATINGNTLRALLAAFHIPQLAREILARYGLPADPQPEHWYPLQAWLDVLSELELFYGERTVYAVGLQIATISVWPTHITTLEQALQALDEACRLNVKGAPIGYYRTESLQPRKMLVHCLTPTPIDFECGIITGIARKFKPADSLRIEVTKESTPLNAPRLLKRFHVKW